MRITKMLLLSLLTCLTTFVPTYALGSIRAGYPLGEWWLALFLMCIMFVPAIQAIFFFLWVIYAKFRKPKAAPTLKRAALFGAIIGLIISAVSLYTDLL